MGRRRRPGTPPPKPFDDAFSLIDKLENAVVTRMVVPEFDELQVLRCMYTDDVVDMLRAAWPFTRAIDQGSQVNEEMRIPRPSEVAITVAVTIDAKRAQILIPEKGNVKMDRVLAFRPLVAAIEETHEQHLRFEKVRQAVRWLNENATVGAARHYCPWLTAILPAEHPFQKVDGRIYREPAAGMGEIMPIMRECAAIMASALLVGNLDHTSAKTRFMLAFIGKRDKETYTSQRFGLL